MLKKNGVSANIGRIGSEFKIFICHKKFFAKIKVQRQILK